MPVPGCAAGYQPLCPPPFPQRAHLLLLGAPHTPASLEGSSREIQIILLQGFEPIESHKVMRLLETRLLVLGMQESDLPLPGEGCMGLCVCLSVESGWGEGRAVSDVRPCLGRGPGLYMEKRLTLSSGVFFSAFLSFSALFPWMGKKTGKLLLPPGGDPSLPLLVLADLSHPGFSLLFSTCYGAAKPSTPSHLCG